MYTSAFRSVDSWLSKGGAGETEDQDWNRKYEGGGGPR